MARHQASMTQLNKMVTVIEYPPDLDDNVPVQHTISSLERLGIINTSVTQYKGKTVLPLIWNVDPDVPDYLLGDTMRLTQILLNLCSNAVKVSFFFLISLLLILVLIIFLCLFCFISFYLSFFF